FSPLTLFSMAPEHGLIPLSFPKTKVALWNPAPLGDTISLHLAYYRNPKLLVVERTLRLAHRHAKQTERNQFFCFLLGSVVHDVDDEGVALMVDRLDPGREVPGRSEKIPTALLPGDFLIPCIIDARGTTFSDIIVHSAEDFNIAFQMLHCYCCSKETIDHSRLLTMRAHITCIESMDSLRLELHWAAVTVANIFDATPVNPVPIIPTALARNLTSPINIAQVQGTCKFGYLTMDQTRKLLLILESDPKAFTLPLVGIWLSGVIHIQSPQVWASCLRYMFSSSIQERVFSTEQKSFLLVLYSLTHKEPEFYECHPYGEHQKLDFQLLTSTEVINLYKNAESSGKQPIEFELSENQNSESDFFKEVASKILELPSNKISGGDQDSGVGEEDLSPRPMPSPHPVGQQFPRICPSVPELSIVFDGSFIEPKNSTTKPHQNKAPIMPPKKNATCGNFNLMKPYSENRQPGLASHGAAPFQKQTCPPSKQSIPSANTMDQPKLLSPTNRVEALHNVVLRKGAFPSRGRQSLPNTRQPPSPIKSNRPSLQHTPTFLPHSPVRTSEIPMMGPPPHFPIQYPTHYCNCCQHHGPYCVPSMNANWQGNGLTYGSTGVHSPICHDCNPVVCHQNLGLSPISHYNAVYGNTSPMNQSFQSQVNGPSACVPFSGVRMGPDQEANGAMGLPVDAYKMLVEQDRQLKLLQAQIQRLLDTQTCAVRTPAGIPCASTSVGISNLVPQPERQMDFDKMETQTSGIQMRKSVSIAVNTGKTQLKNGCFFFLKGQVNQILQSSPSENQGMDDEVVESEISEVMQTSRSRNKRSKTHTYLKDENDVLSATMKQLKKMGVQIDLETSNSTKKIKNKVENASTLACIHPAAVIPRLNYMSFANVNTSGFGTGAVDLSMEANAIALKYLNDSQLSQIAQSRNDTNDQSHNLLQLNPDKSLVGLSLISPNNMSFATRKYMMRYGLIECDNSSEEEEDSLEAIDQHESVAFRKEKIEKVSEGKKSINKHRSPGSFSEMDRNVLRNISNGIASSKSVNIVEPPIQQESQPYLKSVKPKMKMHVGETYYTQHPEKENGIETLLTSNKIKPISPETPKHSESNSMVGNILDVSRLRQLPKLF
uniref:STIL centriolar assembly protein n=1 Tax=Callorhinchus milii TaxID=7868 RepID=A0A4W3KI33_CALMI